MVQQVKAEDGTLHEFPDEATPDQMMAAISSSKPAAPAEKPGIMARIGAGAAGLVSGAAEMVGLGAPVEVAEMAAGRQPAPHFGAPGPFGATAEQVRGVEQQTRGVTPGGLVKGAVQGIVQPFKTIGSAIVNPPQTLGQAYDVGKAVPQAAATLEGARALTMGGLKLAAKAATPEARTTAAAAAVDTTQAKLRAQNYVKENTGLNFRNLTPEFQQKMVDIATDPARLQSQDPKVIAREARAAKFGYPLSKGQAERNKAQITREEILSSSPEGQKLTDISESQDVALHAAIDKLRSSTGATAKTAEDIGKSLQTASRQKLKLLKSQKTEAYQTAERFGEMDLPMDAEPLVEMVESDPNIARYTDLKSLLSDYLEKPESVEGKEQAKMPGMEPAPAKDFKNPNPQQDSILEFMAKHKIGLSSEQAIAEGIDPESLRPAPGRAGFVGIKRAFRKDGLSFDNAAEVLSEYGYPVVDKQGRYDPNMLLDAISEELNGNPRYSDSNTHRMEMRMWEQDARERQAQGQQAPPPPAPKIKPTITPNNLESVRQALNTAQKGTPAGYFSGRVIKMITQIQDEHGSPFFKEARAKEKAWRDEFDRQGRIKKLVTQQGLSTDRAVALEKTTDFVIGSSLEQIRGIKKSLVTGGNKQTREMGRQAWKNVQAGVIDRLKEAASKGATVGEDEQLEFNTAFRREFLKLDRAGRLEEIFPKPIVRELRQLQAAVTDVRQVPRGRQKTGPDTAGRLMNILSMIGKFAPNVVTDFAVGTAKAVKKVTAVGSEARSVKEATITPTTEAAEEAKKQTKKKLKRAQTLSTLQKYGAKPSNTGRASFLTVPITRGMQDEQQ